MIKFHQKYFIESIHYDKINPEKIRQNNQRFKNINNIENKLIQFQIYPETELACKYNTPLYKTQYSEILVEYEKSFNMNTGKLIISQYPTYHNKNDENSYIPVKFLKKHRKNWWTTSTTRQKQYTLTRTITYEQYLFWCNSL